MTIKPGFEDEYKVRHDNIWPELSAVLKDAGISDYSIFLEDSSNKLFAVLWREDNHKMDELPHHPIVKKWWEYMSDIMLCNADNSPVVTDLKNVFHLQ